MRYKCPKFAFFILPETKMKTRNLQKGDSTDIIQSIIFQVYHIYDNFLYSRFWTYGAINSTIHEHTWVDLSLPSEERLVLGAKYTGISGCYWNRIKHYSVD